MSFLIIAVFLLTALASVPIAHGLLIAALVAVAASSKIPLDILVQTMVQQVQSFPLIAIPFFMLTGSLMMGGKLGEALIGVLTRLIGRYHKWACYQAPYLVGCLARRWQMHQPLVRS
jgi:TRAP-type transport system large permease protein